MEPATPGSKKRFVSFPEDCMKIAAAQALLKNIQDPNTQSILQTLSKRAHNSIFFIMKVPNTIRSASLDVNTLDPGEKRLKKIPKDLITHVLIPNPTSKSNTADFSNVIPESDVIIRFVDSKQEHIVLNFGSGFCLSEVGVNCQDSETALMEVFEEDIKGQNFTCFTHIRRRNI